MALASVLERPLPVNRRGFFGLGGRADLLDLGPGSPSDGLSLAAPSWGVPEEPRIEMLHGTTTLAFKVQTQPPRRAESCPPAPFPASQRVQNPPWPRPRSPGGGSGLSPRPRQFRCLIVLRGLGSCSGGSGVAVGLGNSEGKWEKDFEAVWIDSQATPGCSCPGKRRPQRQ